MIVGEEIKSADGDLVALFLDERSPPGLPADETIAAVHAQGGLVGIPHPFDRFRGSLLRTPGWNGSSRWSTGSRPTTPGSCSATATSRPRSSPRATRRPGIAVSDAHSTSRSASPTRAFDGDPSTAAGLLAALPTAELVLGRASLYVRLWTPIAKTVQRARGNRRVQPPRIARCR